MCDCHTKIDEKLKPLNGRLATGFNVTPNGIEMTLLMQVEKINARGKKPPHVLPTFCPFCGTKVDGVAKTRAEAEALSSGDRQP
jgi:hypothetical protein